MLVNQLNKTTVELVMETVKQLLRILKQNKLNPIQPKFKPSNVFMLYS